MSSEIGERLRQERERLGLTQAAFAQKTGISSRALRNYESGTRVPDVRYLFATAELGVDANYVLSGMSDEEHINHLKGNALTLLLLATMLELDMEALEKISRSNIEAVTTGNSSKTPRDQLMELEELLAQSPRILMMCGNPDAIADDIELMSTLLNKVGDALPREKKARVISMLYRSFKTSGKIDDKMIEDAISLAT